MPKAQIYIHPSLYSDRGISEPTTNSEAAFNNIYNDYQNKAYKKGRTFNITKAKFKELITKDCFYCGAKPSNTKVIRGQSFSYNGLDRLDNEKPYTLDNVVPSCKVCNFMKGTNNLHDFMNQVVKINRHLAQNNLPKQYPKS